MSSDVCLWKDWLYHHYYHIITIERLRSKTKEGLLGHICKYSKLIYSYLFIFFVELSFWKILNTLCKNLYLAVFTVDRKKSFLLFCVQQNNCTESHSETQQLFAHIIFWNLSINPTKKLQSDVSVVNRSHMPKISFFWAFAKIWPEPLNVIVIITIYNQHHCLSLLLLLLSLNFSS